MTAQFWLGLAVLPALALLAWLWLHAARAIHEARSRWRPTAIIGSESKRADHAALLAVARRVRLIRLPGGRVYAYRTSVPARWSSDPAYQAWAIVRDALDDALHEAGRAG